MNIDGLPVSTVKLPGYASPVLLSDIMYISAESNYAKFHLSSGKRLLVSYHLGYYDLTLRSFLRIHKCFLVNPAFIVSAQRLAPTEGIVTLRNDTILPIAKRRITATLALLRERAIVGSVEVVSSNLP
jgi:DNA-binding LytR/AlgR family response regulator